MTKLKSSPEPTRQEQIHYKSGYKYQLAENYRVKTPITGHTISQGPIKLTVNGWLTIKKGYAWDGPSGPAIDTKNFMRGSLVHDALYQLMRNGRLSACAWRGKVDQLLRDMCIQDGMWRIRAAWVFWAVQNFAARAADKDHKRETLTAP
jgi:hypothetical protein